MVSYVPNSQDTVAQYISTRPILDLCKEKVRRSGKWVARGWWEEEVLNLAGAMAVAMAAEDGEGKSEGGEEER